MNTYVSLPCEFWKSLKGYICKEGRTITHMDIKLYKYLHKHIINVTSVYK